MLRLSEDTYLRMVGHCYDGLPLEACGLLAGDPATGKAVHCYPTKNEAASARVYAIGFDYAKAERDADERGITILGVFHSHTHTDAYPSPTDVAQAVDPSWHYVLVSLRDGVPVVRSYLIRDGKILEEPVVLERR
ncbi:MAG: M67 family metallopeptidase [Actinomycetota bacterium]|nr:M67 family metallopeptidase [Actinomycetota bacterium]